MQIELKNLNILAQGLNIEGGFPIIDLLKTNPNGKWVNLILVLDRPLIDNIVFDDIFLNNKYPLLESAIDDLNEHHFLAAYLLIIGYYLENGHKLFGINNMFRIMVHVHQDTKSMPLVELIKSYVEKLWPEWYLNSKNIILEFKTDYKDYLQTNRNYEYIDLLISLSQCAGLDVNFVPGTLLMANKFIPYNIDKGVIRLKDAYTAPNILNDHLFEIISSKQHELVINFINKYHVSPNIRKKGHKAQTFTLESFQGVNILQVNKLWNPMQNEIVNIL